MENLVKAALNMKYQEMSGKTDRISTGAHQYLVSVFRKVCFIWFVIVRVFSVWCQ